MQPGEFEDKYLKIGWQFLNVAKLWFLDKALYLFLKKKKSMWFVTEENQNLG